jgi:hypothetical protein
MRLENLLREKIYTFAHKAEASEIEKQIIKEIAVKEHLGELKAAKTLDSNDDFDIFLAEIDDFQYVAKTTLDAESSSLQRNFCALDFLQNNYVCPAPIFLGELKDWGVKYSVESYLDGQSLEEVGKSEILKFEKSFVSGLRYIHTNKSLHKQSRTFSTMLEEKFSLRRKMVEKIDFSTDEHIGKICIQALDELETQIKTLYKTYMGDGVCHGNITPSKIIPLASEVFFISFENNYRAHPLFDLLGLKYDFFFGDSGEQKIVESYEKYIKFSNVEIKEIRAIVKSLKFYDLIMEFMKEVYIYKACRPQKILKLTEKMSKSFGLFSGLPAFDRNRQKIGQLFASSVI